MTSHRSIPGSGEAMFQLIAELYPLCRSITGEGIRQTLRRLGELIPLTLHDVPSGTRVLDWIVPPEWNIGDAWVANPAGERVIDFRRHNLHLVSYSAPVRRRMSLAELRPHLHTLPDHPDWIPYRTTYYAETWGFCLAQRDLDAMPDGDYEVHIDSTLAPGSLTYGELLLPGELDEEILISCHCCHPSLANDNLSGVAVAVWLARHLSERPRRHGIRFLFIPGTIGSITWLAQHPEEAKRVRHGLVLSCLGDEGPSCYKRSRQGHALVDRAAEHVLRSAGLAGISDFVPYGYDERQYCSPGFDLAVGCLTRSPNGTFPEYHTSADNLDFIKPNALQDSLDKALAIIEILESNATYLNLSPRGEPQLGRRGLYHSVGGEQVPKESQMALLWVLSFSDGRHSLLDIAERAGMRFEIIRLAASTLERAGLLKPVPGTEPAPTGPHSTRPVAPSAAEAAQSPSGGGA